MAPRGRSGTAGRFWWRVKGFAARHRERLAPATTATSDTTELDDLRRRLELMLFALHGRAVSIHDAPTPESSMLDRVKRNLVPRHLRDDPIAWTDGDMVLLPPRLRDPRGDPAGGVAQYRLLALVQAERIVRGTASVLPALAEPLERDLFLLRESMAVEARLTRDIGGLAEPLAHARRAALSARPPLGALTATERGVEAMVREALDPQAAEHDPALADSTPADSLAWARVMSTSLSGAYLGLAPVAHWGGVKGSVQAPASDDDPPGRDENAPRGGMLPLETRTGDPHRDGRESDRDDPTTEGDASTDERSALATKRASDPASDDAEATESRGAADAALLQPNDERPPPREPHGSPGDAEPGVQYPEWDLSEGRYRRNAVTVRERVAEEADTTWASDTLRRNAPMVRRIRERFEPLRAQRIRLGQQRDGEELDLQACVQAIVDARTGHTPSDRIYTSVRPARRAMTICLLVDVSASTRFPVPTGQRIIDVEREAVLLASEAFDALGDDYALLTFSSRGARDVRVQTLKDFRERNGSAVHRRIGGIEPGDNTRLGAAVRHAAARLVQQPLGRRLLLILSDGRPNDFDGYHEAAGVEDSRQAIHEARAAGVFPFCITIDQQDGPEYLPRIFGPSGYTVLREPEQLPLALVRVVRQLLVR
ncbi:MAG: VWA domain-containing protein [Gemmatimonadaceae bacterium]|nr:VWA domain-containing protein [Gemmatimonadaceae bacterium]